MMQLVTHTIFLRIAPDKFHFLKFILEGYDNLAILSSHDIRQGIVKIRYPEDSGAELFHLLDAIGPKLIS